MYPLFHAPAVDRAAARYSAACDELARRTGRTFEPVAAHARRARNVNEDEVLRHHPDLCQALNIFPCAGGCNRAAVKYWDHRWLCGHCCPSQ